MEKFRTALITAAGYIVGALLLVGGWWISMLNISIDRFQGSDFTSFWTLAGLVLIFIGAYLPIVISKWRARTVRRHHAELQRAAQHGAVVATAKLSAAETPDAESASDIGTVPPDSAGEHPQT